VQFTREFEQELAEAGLTFRLPDNFSVVNVKANDRVRYTCAIVANSAKLELRYHIVPLKPQPLPEGYTSIASADMNQLHLSHYVALIRNVADSVISNPSPFPDEAVRAEFGADWGAVCRLGLAQSEFAEGFAECMLMCLHRKDVADAYVFFLFDDFAAVSNLIESNFYTLLFAQG
jgi:hypothetical protein